MTDSIKQSWNFKFRPTTTVQRRSSSSAVYTSLTVSFLFQIDLTRANVVYQPTQIDVNWVPPTFCDPLMYTRSAYWRFSTASPHIHVDLSPTPFTTPLTFSFAQRLKNRRHAYSEVLLLCVIKATVTFVCVYRPLGETKTGSRRRSSASVGSVRDITRTVPRLVPTHRHGHVDSSVNNHTNTTDYSDKLQQQQ